MMSSSLKWAVYCHLFSAAVMYLSDTSAYLSQTSTTHCVSVFDIDIDTGTRYLLNNWGQSSIVIILHTIVPIAFKATICVYSTGDFLIYFQAVHGNMMVLQQCLRMCAFQSMHTYICVEPKKCSIRNEGLLQRTWRPLLSLSWKYFIDNFEPRAALVQNQYFVILAIFFYLKHRGNQCWTIGIILIE